MTEKELSAAKGLMLETLDFYKYKLLNDSCTPEEIASLSRLVSGETEMRASIRELAEYFGTSEMNVRHIISRKLFDKPKRVVLYPFQAFLKVVPDKWLKHKDKDK